MTNTNKQKLENLEMFGVAFLLAGIIFMALGVIFSYFPSHHFSEPMFSVFIGLGYTVIGGSLLYYWDRLSSKQ